VTFLPLTLGVRLNSGAEQGAAAPPSKNQIEKTLKQDDYTCRFCGFRSQQFQRVVYHKNKDSSELVTCCTFCEQTLYLERAGMMGSAVLIWLPEIAQAELNHIARAIYVGRSGEGAVVELATRAFDALMARRVDAKKRLGSDDPLLLATILHESMNADEVRSAVQKLNGVRVMPLDKHMGKTKTGEVNQFPHIVKYWCSDHGPFALYSPKKWLDLLDVAVSKTGHA
jgi:intracellular multiplication protein IcmJ